MKKMLLPLLLIVLSLTVLPSAAQIITQADTIDGKVFIDGLPLFTNKDLDGFKSLPIIEIPQATRNRDLPVNVDNSLLPYFRPIFNQSSLECGQAAGVGYLFTYEMDRLRNLPANVPENQYPTHFVFNWSNNGAGNAAAFFDSWNIIKEVGTPNVTDYGGGLNTGGVARWMNGYDLYYRAMKNRLWDFYKIPLNNPSDLEVLKHWIDNHGEGEENGGVAVFYASYMGVNQTLPPGTPEAGKYVLTILGNYANHALTVVGYHDSIRYDINNDGQYTNHLDINNDGNVDILDWEIGGVKLANSYSATSWGNQGFAYLMYSALCRPLHLGGVWNRSVHVINGKESTYPQLTFKAKVTHNVRNLLKVMVGIANGFDATEPEYIVEYPILNYQGGNFYMQGGSSEADKTLEFGLDITQLLKYVESGQDATFFFMVNEKDPSNNGTGMINNLSLMDYTDGLIEIPCNQSNVPLVENGLTTLKINANITFDAPDVLIEALEPATINEPYQFQMLGTGGTEPYQWKIKQEYVAQTGTQTFPMINAQQLSPNSSTSGFATKTIDFDFPFYGKVYNKISIHTDGYLMFSEEPYPWTFLVDELNLFKNLRNISPYMAKALGVSGGGGMWYEGDQNKATFRWKATEYSTSNILNFAVSIYPSGEIEFFYGESNGAAWNKWHAGISDGGDFNYHLLDISNTYNIQPNTKISFEPDFAFSEMKITEDGLFYGTPTRPYEAVDIVFNLKDANGLQGSKALPFFTDGINKIVIREVNVVAGDDDIIEYGETAVLSVELQNISDEVINATQMTINTQNQYITVIDNTLALSSFQPGQVITFTDAFSFDVSMQVPNNLDIIFATEIAAPDETFNSHIYLKAYTPDLAIGTISIEDGNNGYPEPGETLQVLVTIINSGGGKAYNLQSNISTSDPFVTINQGSWSAAVLPGNGSVAAQFEIFVHEDTPTGHLSQINIYASADYGFNVSGSFNFSTGFVVEDFETGDFSSYDWEFGGNAEWFITDQNVYEGQYCMQSGDISDNQVSSVQVTMNVLSDGEISFYYKVTSEANYDFLVFSIDGTTMGSWAGSVDWAEGTFPVQAGERTFSWSYEKDVSVSTGSDCAWVDFIIFPPSAPEGLIVFAGPDMMICENQTPLLQAVVANAISMEWTTSGDGTFSNPSVANPTYTPGQGDISSGSAELTLTAYDNLGASMTDNLVLSITRLPYVYAGEDVTICEVEEIVINAILQYTEVCNWSTSGDGTFSVSNQPNTVYYPGENDLISGNVILTLTGVPVTPCAVSISHSMSIDFLPLPEVSFDELPDFCHNSPGYELIEGSPVGGIYDGPGVSNGWFYPEVAGVGIHELTYTYNDGNGCENFAVQEVFVDDCTGISTPENSGISIFPNPGSGTFTVQFDQNIAGSYRVEVFNSYGQRVYSNVAVFAVSSSTQTLDLTSQPDGVYYLKITGGGASVGAKLVVKR
ncbi:MAG: T9SS type A sorting domain-containing protein [Bacteroidales bacterium]|nr:T9SS type A sorting domain-containing protein [Bacteroidales bacterium]